jgi:hypothetical protein
MNTPEVFYIRILSIDSQKYFNPMFTGKRNLLISRYPEFNSQKYFLLKKFILIIYLGFVAARPRCVVAVVLRH